MSRRTEVAAWVAGGTARLRATTWAIAQCALASMLAWGFAGAVIGHPRPFFAPAAALVCLGVSHAHRLRRIGELALGVSIGVGVADLLVREIGNGWWQLGLVVVLALATAQFFGGGGLVSTQAGVQAIFLVALPQTPGGGLYRWEDALIGGSCALLVAAALPGDPARAVQSQARLLIAALAAVVADAAHALREGEAELADAALERARGTQADVERWSEALRGGEEIRRISPLRHRRRDDLSRYRQALVGADRAARNMRVALRRIATVLERGDAMPPALAGILQELADVLGVLEYEVGDPSADQARAGLVSLAVRLDPEQLGAHTMSEHVLVAQVRSAVVDLLGATGTDAAHAQALLPDPHS